MKVLFDTNILIDWLTRRTPFYHNSRAAMRLAMSGRVDAIASASSIKDVHYVISRHYRDTGDALALIAELLEIVRLADTTAQDVLNALQSGNVDFEDAVVSETAAREFADFIVTRNKSDFSGSPVPALLPSELIEKFR